jgi:threonylcarbamoyladenosine tRNA methylthiotransferase CDKAL1
MYRTFYVHHNGCEPILFEHERIRMFYAEQFGIGPSKKENSDVIILTICTFTEQKEKESINLINDCLKTNAKKVIVTGCFLNKYVESERVLYLKFPELTKYLKDNFKSNKSKAINNIDNTLDTIVAVSRGCYGTCTFCSIRFAKGKHVSRPVNEILHDIEKRKHHGWVKIVGDDLAAFGQDTGTNLFELISKIHRQFPSIDIKLGSLNVKLLKNYNKEELAIFAKTYIKGNIHIPLQSASNSILELMQRDYTIADYERIYDMFRDLGVKNISTDLICGFPEETEADHKMNLEFMAKHDFNFVEFFMYQKRQSTKAAQMKQLPESVKRKRTIEAIGIFINEYVDKREVPLDNIKELTIYNTNIKMSWKQLEK